jgi:serine/threonine protein kinase
MALPFRPREYYGAVVKTVGEGGFGRVIMTDRNYAIKLAYTNNGFPSETILQEIVSLLKVNSPYLIPLIDVIISDEDIGLVLPLANTTLSSVMGNPTLDIKKLMRQLCLGIADIHNASLLHLDVKPGNMLLFLPDGIDPSNDKTNYADASLVITDFGISRIHTCALEPLTTALFTSGYRSPEILLEGPITAKADVWAVGVVFTELLMSRDRGSRQHLFYGTDERELDKIFELLGTPTSGPLTTLPEWSDKFPKWPNKLRSHLKTYNLTDEEIDFVEYILNLDYEARPTIFDVLRHPWLAPTISPEQFTCMEMLNIYSHHPPNSWLSQTERQNIINWTAKVAYTLGGAEEALSLAVYLIDRMTSIRQNQMNRLYAYAALFISHTFYAFYFLRIKDVNPVGNDSFSKEQLRDAVYDILKTTSFDLAVVTSYHYLSRHLLQEEEEEEEKREELERLMKRHIKRHMKRVWRASLFTQSHFQHPSKVADAIISLSDPSKKLTEEAIALYNEIMNLPGRLFIGAKLNVTITMNDLQKVLSQDRRIVEWISKKDLSTNPDRK